MQKRWWAFVAPAVLMGAVLSFVQTSRATSETQNRSLRVMTYNIEWFSENSSMGRINNLKSVIGNIRPDVIALQEIQSKAALRQIFDSNWEIIMVDDPKEDQELALAVRRPLRVVTWEMVFKGEALEGPFPRGRDALRAVIELDGSRQFTIYSTHMKSRGGGRANTDWQRQMQAGMLASYIKWKNEPNVIVAGDFNDAPNDVTANILETGDLFAPAGPATPRLMVNLCDPLCEKDYVTIGLSSLYTGRALSPIRPGARAENDRFRGQNPRFPDDFMVTQSFFDQILMSKGLAATTSGTAEIYSGGDALQGRGGRVEVTDTGVNYTEKGDRASDHLPVFVDFRIP
ncbi:MAG: endonuclease/exonuclease/phosphatase family protein [Fimbriimonadaceae bacterium]|nr:endonuclease/exonuclease/phosphatase family protein [Fimbriimonadaceae bacterium]